MKKIKQILTIILCLSMFSNHIVFSSPSLNLSLKLNDDGSIIATWSSVGGNAGYSLHVYNTINEMRTYVNEQNLKTTSYIVDNLPLNKVYRFDLSAKDNTGKTIISDSKSIHIPLGHGTSTGVSTPTNVSATASTNSVIVSWSSVTGATSYDVILNGSVYNTTSTSRIITGLQPNTTYSYSVRAKNSEATGENSPSYTIRTLSLGLSAPDNVSATSTSTTVKVSWSEVAGATSYDVIINGETYNTSGTFITITGLQPNTNYNYTVSAKDSSGSSVNSDSYSIRTSSLLVGIPTNINAVAGSNKVTINWNAVPGATSYDVAINRRIHNVADRTATINGLEPNTSYTYSVRAKNSSNGSDYSDTRTIKTLPATISQPTNVKATAAINSVNLSWDRVAGATSYDVIINGVVHNTSNTSITITGLNSNTVYTYYVQAINSGGASSFSEPSSITTIARAPNTPTNSRATSTINTVTIMWNPVAGAASYDVIFNGVTYNTTDTSLTITDLEINTAYTYSARAKNSGGTSEYSEPKTILTAPSIPTNVSVKSFTDFMEIRWDEVPGATSYDVMFDRNIYNTERTSRTFAYLHPNTSYTYKVRANSSGGSSEYSEQQTVLTGPLTPINVIGTSTSSTITLNWDAVQGATSYEVEINGDIYTSIVNSITITGLEPGRLYSIRLRAKNSGGSSLNASKSISTLPLAPDTPTNISATSTSNTATVSWDAAPRASSYDLVFDGITYNTTTRSRIITGLEPNTSYAYTVQAKNSGGTSEISLSYVINTEEAALTVPANITATATINTATISWDKVDGATGYDLVFDGKTHNLSRDSNTITGLRANTNYTYSVRSKNSKGTSEYSDTKTILTAPANPHNVYQIAKSNTVTINWSEVPGAVSYDFKFNGFIYSTTELSKTITGLDPNTRYTYTIKAINYEGTGEESAEHTVLTAPIIPTNISVVSTSGLVTVSWDAVPGARSYDVALNGNVYNTPVTSRTITGLQSGTEYTYSVRSVNGHSSEYSEPKTLFTVPARPAGMSATVTSNTATISWLEVRGATSYEIIINQDTYTTKDTIITIPQLEPSTRYIYTVRAKNSGGASDSSLQNQFTTLAQIPDKPTNINATATSNTVTINWDRVSGATNYDVIFNGSRYNTTSTSRTITGLSPKRTYTYTVSAKSPAGASENSDPQTITTLPTPPNIPTNVSAKGTSNTITVSWNESARATSYDVILDGVTYNTTSTSKTITGLEPNVRYSYAVQAKNDGGTSSSSNSRSILTAPIAPSNISATSSYSSVTLNWPAVTGARVYYIYINGNMYGTTNTFITITGLSNNKEYPYTITVSNNESESEHSDTYFVRTLRTAANPVRNIKATSTHNSITISWDGHSNSDSYDVILNGVTYNTTDTFITITDLNPNSIYTYSVSGRNPVGVSSQSAPVNIVTLPTPPATPTNVNATATSTNATTVSWDRVTGATSYDVLFNGTIYNTTSTSRVFTSLNPNTSYTYSVQAKNASGASNSSETKTITTLSNAPSAPTNVSATSTSNTATVKWDPVPGATSYDVSFNGMEYNTTGNSKTITGLKPKTNYSYSVKAKNSGGTSPNSGTKAILTRSAPSYKRGTQQSNNNKKPYINGKMSYNALDPINGLNGAFLWNYTYLNTYGKDDLEFTLMYDSQSSYNGVLGNKWTYSLNYLLKEDDDYIYFYTPYDEIIPFEYNSDTNTFNSGEDILIDYKLELKQDDNLYSVSHLDGAKYIFDSNFILREIVEGGLTTYKFTSNSKGDIVKISGLYGANFDIEYNDGRISKVIDYIGNTSIFIYSDDYLVESTNPDGNTIFFTYDNNSKNLIHITDFSGTNYVTNTYDSKNRIVKQNVVDRGDSFVNYNEINHVNTFTDELENSIKYFYDENNNITKVEYNEGEISNKYNINGQIIEQIDALGNSIKMDYDVIGRLTRIVYPDGTTERISYNNNNYPIKVINPDDTETFYEYDSRNNVISITDERGNTEYFAYDDEDNLILYTDKEGYISSYTYDENGFLKSYNDSEGNVYRYNFDEIGRLLSYVSPLGNTSTYTYSATGNLLSVTDVDGTVYYTYDENGNNSSITDKMGNKQYFEYYGMGQISSETDFMGNVERYVYDMRGNLAEEIDPLNYSQKYYYDEIGNLIKVIDKNGNATQNFFDASNQIIEVKNALGESIKFTYDTMGQIKIVTDAKGNDTEYSYDYMGRVIKETNALGYSKSFTYDEVGNLLTEKDENGYITEYTYDKEDRIKSIATEFGVISFTYDKLGRLISSQDEEGHSESIQYDSEGNVISISDKENNKITYVYNDSGLLSEEVDSEGNVTKYEYDKNGNCIKIIDSNGNVYNYQYDANDQLINIIDPMNYSTIYVYNPRGELTSIVDANGGNLIFEYDGNGNLIKTINPLGGEIIQTFNAVNQLIGIKDENGYVSSYSYDQNGNVISFTDANENKWIYEYDAVDRLISVTDSNGNKISLDYDKMDNIVKLTDQEGIETYYEYDSLGRVIKITDAMGNTLNQKYDSQGRIVQQTDENGNATEYEYTPNGNVKSIKDPMGGVITYTYNTLGWLTAEKDALGNIISYEYDGIGQVVKMTDAMGNVTKFDYNASGLIQAVTDARGGITNYVYDGNENLVQTTDPEGNTTYYEYDALNNQIKHYKGSNSKQGAITIYQYDKKGQLIKEINPSKYEKVYFYDGNGNVVKEIDEDKNEITYVYDLNDKPTTIRYSDGKEIIYRYNKRGELVEFRDWNGITNLDYDKLGRLIKVNDHNNMITSYTYDGNGNKTSINYPDAGVVRYSYDATSRMIAVEEDNNETTKFEYDKNGNTTRILQPNGNITKYQYNANNQPINIEYLLSDGTQLSNRLSYDQVGNIISSIERGKNQELIKTITYQYDKIDQLISFTEENKTTSYRYDGNGNIVEKRINGMLESKYTYNEQSQLLIKEAERLQYSYIYDKRGNLIEEKRNNTPIKRYEYDSTNRMVVGENLDTGEQSQYTYNGLNMRVRLNQTVQNLNNGYQNNNALNITNGILLEELDLIEQQTYETITELIGENNPFINIDTLYVIDYTIEANNELMMLQKDNYNTSITYGRGTERLGQTVKNGNGINNPNTVIATELIGKSYVQRDTLGSPLFISNKKGQVLRHIERDPWGNKAIPIAHDMNIAGLESMDVYTNHSYDTVLEKYFAQARFYDSINGRMTSIDPINTGTNRYIYSYNNPVNYIDPTGEIPVLAGVVIGGTIGAAIGFVSSVIGQRASGKRVSVKKALGSAVNYGIVNAVRAGLIASGAGIVGLASKGIASGIAGNMAQQYISNGRINSGKAIRAGIVEGVSSLAFGSKPIKGALKTAARGARAGAVSAGMGNAGSQLRNNNNSNTNKNSKGAIINVVWPYSGNNASVSNNNKKVSRTNPIKKSSSSGDGKVSKDPRFSSTSNYDFRYRPTIGNNSSQRQKFDARSLATAMMGGAVAGAAFYGAGKLFGAASQAIKSARNGSKGTVSSFGAGYNGAEYDDFIRKSVTGRATVNQFNPRLNMNLGFFGNKGSGNTNINAGNLKYSNSSKYPNRPYQDSPTTIQNIIVSKPPTVDPRGSDGLWWKVKGTYNGSQGYYELLISPDKTTIWHFLFKSN